MTLWAWLDTIPIAVYALVAVVVLLFVEVLALRQDLRRLREWRTAQHIGRMQDLDRLAELDDAHREARKLLFRYTRVYEPPDEDTRSRLAWYLGKTSGLNKGDNDDYSKFVGLDGRAL